MDDADQLHSAVHALEWAHTIDLGNGLVTPGKWPPSPLILKALESVDFSGKKVLDVGCWDGLWSFEAEKRGAAEVYATDYVAHRPLREFATFDLAKQVLHSRAHYHPKLSVYDVGKLGINDFDIVLYFGVYYHIKDPLLALARLRQVMKTGALLIIEGEVINDERVSSAEFFYSETHAEDRSTWWVPTVACLREWVKCSYFDLMSEYNVARDSMSDGMLDKIKKGIKRTTGISSRYSRCVLTARAVCRQDDRYPFPDEELHQFSTDSR